jgi:transcriptional regulator with XRE-family HTH domain
MTSGGDRRQPRSRPAWVRVRYGSDEYVRDLNKCRVALRSRLLDGSFKDKNMGAFARSVGLSLATVSKWLNGVEAGRKDTTDRILAGLKVSFDDVHEWVELMEPPAPDALEESES